jgi:hypothetical protein
MKATHYLVRIELCCIAVVCLFFFIPVAAQETFVPPLKAERPGATTTLDQLYYLQPHNTYAHGRDFAGWLDSGYRAVEIDVIDRGNWENEVDGPYVAHDADPMKANCGTAPQTRLKDCLTTILDWRARHPGDTTPLLVFVDMKTTVQDLLVAWPAEKVGRLDEYVGKAIPAADRYTYAELTSYIESAAGASPRLKLKDRGWPAIGLLGNKIVVILTGGRVGAVNQNMNKGREWLLAHNLSQNTFFCPDVDAGAPGEISTTIDGLTEAESGYFFCANVKAGDHDERVLNRSAEYRQLLHLWDHSGDFTNKDYAYAYVGVAHGVGALGIDVTEDLSSTVYYRPEWIDSIPYVGVRRSLPGYFMVPTQVSEQKGCVGVDGDSYGNGKRIVQSSCNSGSNGQQFVYTAEGQLRPRGNNTYCLDIKGGSAGAGKEMNLWGCDGGRSEKWFITPDGLIANHDKGEGFSMAVDGNSPANGTLMKLRACGTSDAAQRLVFRQVPDWYPAED